jgi:hypothetical protein
VCVGGLDLGLFLSPAGRQRDNAGDGHRSDHVHQHQRRDHRHRLFRFLGTLRENGTSVQKKRGLPHGQPSTTSDFHFVPAES